MKKKDVCIGGVYLAKVSGRLAKVRITGESRFGGWDAVNCETNRQVRIRGAQRLRSRRLDKPAAGTKPGTETTGTTGLPPVATEPSGEATSQEERGDATLPNTVDHAKPQTVGQEGDETMSKKAKTEKEGRVIACSKCGRVIKLVKKAKGGGWHGRCECGQVYSLGKRLVKVNGDTKSLDIPAAETLEAPPASAKATADRKAPTSAKATAGKPAKASRKREAGKMSGLDAAAKVLADANEPLDTKTMVERMIGQGLWTTGGKTPAATIYAAIIREISVKGDASRFVKADRGKFELVK